MVLKLCLWRSYNLLPTFGTVHELENSLRMPINWRGNLKGSLGGPRKPTWRWNLKFFFHGINFYYKRGYFCEKRGYKSSKTKKFFFAQIPHAFIQCTAVPLHYYQQAVKFTVNVTKFPYKAVTFYVGYILR